MIEYIECYKTKRIQLSLKNLSPLPYSAQYLN
ncbi:MAG TPA: hypothetical protein DD638_04820 [Pasteurellaceae bacterium]|nr:hypothetical protein [Pasteurellaceae bacterium]